MKKRKRSASTSPNGGELPGNASFDVGSRRKKQKKERKEKKEKKKKKAESGNASGESGVIRRY